MRRAAGLALMALAVPATAEAASGRAVYDLGGRLGTMRSVDPRGFTAGAALPGGRAVVAAPTRARGAVLAFLAPDGAVERVVELGDGIAAPLQVLRRGDGRLVLVSAPGGLLRLDLRLPDGARDPGFADGDGVATGIRLGCGSCAPAALEADGSVLVTGVLNEPLEPPAPGAGPATRWAVQRIGPGGNPDGRFGGTSVAVLGEPGSAGAAVAPLPGGGVAALGRAGGAPASATLLRLDALGRRIAEPVAVGDDTFAFGLVTEADGSAWVGTDRRVLRLAPDGTRTADVVLPGPAPGPRALLPAPGGGVLSVGPRELEGGRGTVLASRIGPDGRLAADAAVPLDLGGGLATFPARRRLPVVGPLVQSGLQPTGLPLVRDDGRVLVLGALRAVQYTGEGTGFGAERAVAAALAPDLRLDPAFGGDPAPAAVRVAVRAQRAATSRGLRRVAVTVRASDAGLVRLEARQAGRLVARSVALVDRAGARSASALLTRTGRRALRPGPVRVTATFRDLLGRVARSGTSGRLR